MGIGLITERATGIRIQTLEKEATMETNVNRITSGGQKDPGQSDRQMRYRRRDCIIWKECKMIDD